MSQAISAAALKIMVVNMKCAPHFLLDRLRKTAYDHMCSHEHSGRDYKGMTLIFHFFKNISLLLVIGHKVMWKESRSKSFKRSHYMKHALAGDELCCIKSLLSFTPQLSKQNYNKV